MISLTYRKASNSNRINLVSFTQIGSGAVVSDLTGTNFGSSDKFRLMVVADGASEKYKIYSIDVTTTKLGHTNPI